MSTLVLPNGVTVATNALARRVTFDDTMLHCELQDGRIISVPLSWYPRLHRANAEQRNNWELIGRGSGIHWPVFDEDLPVRAFLAGCESPKEVPDKDYIPLVERIEPITNQWEYKSSSQRGYEKVVLEPA